ncbi:MAG: DUF6049 family protein, partial [Nocardioides sp.]
PLTWLIDPAVPAAAEHLAAGNLPFDLSSTLPADRAEETDESAVDPGEPGEQTAEPSDQSDQPTADPSDPPSTTTDDPSPAEPIDGVEPPKPGISEDDAADAADWHQRLLDVLRQPKQPGAVVSLPYGDLDVAASLAKGHRGLLDYAWSRSATEMERLDVRTSFGVAPPRGALPPATYGELGDADLVLVGRKAYAGPPPARARIGGRDLTTSRFAWSGPGPGENRSMLQLRQMILSQAALRLLGDDSRTHSLVVQFPRQWDPADGAISAAQFFEGFDRLGWLKLTTIDGAVTGESLKPVTRRDLGYPKRQTKRELPADVLASAGELIERGQILQATLVRNSGSGTQVTEAALSAASYSDRARPMAARATAEAGQEWIRDELGKIAITTPRSLRLPSGTGKLPVTVTNGLDYPVRVRLRPGDGSTAVEIEDPGSIRLAPGEKYADILAVSASRSGVHDFELMVTDTAKRPLGASTQLPVRSAQVGRIIWLIMGVGVALLLSAIAVRLTRRIRAARPVARERSHLTSGVT